MGKTVTLGIQHGGFFNKDPLYYKGGSIDYEYDYDVDKMSYFELKAVCDDHAAKKTVRMYFRAPNSTYEDGLRRISNDNDVADLCSCRGDMGPIPVYALSEDACAYDPLDRGHEENEDTGDSSSEGEDQEEDNEPDLANGVVYEDDNDSESDVASLDHISEDEEEVIHFRKKRIERKKKQVMQQQVNQQEVENANEVETNGEPSVDGSAEPNTEPNSEPTQEPNSQNGEGASQRKGKGNGGPSKQSMQDKDQTLDPPTTAHLHDEFLTELCPQFDPSKYVEPPPFDDFGDYEVPLGEEEGEAYGFPIHNPKTKWKKMKPVLGERYANPGQLKICLMNYAVANGYRIRHLKSDQRRLIAVCGPPKKKDPLEEIQSGGKKKGDNRKLNGKKDDKCKKGKKKGKEKGDMLLDEEEEDESIECPWRLMAAWMTNERSFQVKSLHDVHLCSRNYTIKLVTYEWIANQLAPRIRQNPTWKVRDIKAEVLREYKVRTTWTQCYRARKKVLNEIEGNLIEHYGKLWDYAAELSRSNVGSTIRMTVNRPTPNDRAVFERFYCCFDAIKNGWLAGCRKFIGLDGCFLKTIVKGQILAAVGRDGNNQMYPIAWAHVEKEDYHSWSWFIELLKDDLDSVDGTGWCIMSDQQKGMDLAIRKLLPRAEVRKCARHIYANFRKKFKGVEYRNLFWQAAKSSTVEEYETVMKDLRRLDEKAHKHLTDRNPEQWSRAFFQTDVLCANVENNLSEVFNAYIIEARSKPILTCNEEIRLALMERMEKQRQWIARLNDSICPTIRRRLERNKLDHRHWTVYHNGEHGFEVKQGSYGYKVFLDSKECSCRMWQLEGIPCAHACAAILDLERNPDRFVAACYKKEAIEATYSEYLKPVNGINLWPTTGVEPVLPPRARRGKGRPQTVRRKEEGERGARGSKTNGEGTSTVERERYSTAYQISRQGRQMRCKKCLQVGHNVRSCKNEKVDPPPKVQGRPGRPRKHHPTEDNGQKTTKRSRMSNAGTSGQARATTPPIRASNFMRRHERPQIGFGVQYDPITGEILLGNKDGVPLPAEDPYENNEPEVDDSVPEAQQEVAEQSVDEQEVAEQIVYEQELADQIAYEQEVAEQIHIEAQQGVRCFFGKSPPRPTLAARGMPSQRIQSPLRKKQVLEPTRRSPRILAQFLRAREPLPGEEGSREMPYTIDFPGQDELPLSSSAPEVPNSQRKKMTPKKGKKNLKF